MISTRFYLDTRQTSDGKPAPLKIKLTFNGASTYFSTGISMPAGEWDSAARQAKDASTQLTATAIKYKVDTTLLDLTEKRRLDGLSVFEIRDLLDGLLNPAKSAENRFMKILEEYATSREKQRTKEIYMATYHRIEQFACAAKTLRFEDITIGWLDRFDSFLARTSPKKNARNIHLRNIRAVFNYAKRRGYTSCYPFLDYEIRAEATAKRCLSPEQLRTLFNADVPEWQRKYIDFFMLSFFLIGANTEDLVHATSLNGGRLEYKRAKTGKEMSIKVEPECAEIMARYQGRGQLLDMMDTYANTHNWTSKVNNVLKEVSAGLGLPAISMYWSRHSWATIAAELDIPIETIGAALGHTQKTVTQIYIKFNQSKIDIANRRVMDYVLYGRRQLSILDAINNNIEQLKAQISCIG